MSKTAPTRAEAEALMEEFSAAMIAKDAAALAALCTADVLWRYPFNHGRGADLCGRAAVHARYAEAWAAAPVRPVSIRSIGLHLADDGVVVAEAEMDVEHDSGKRFAAAFILCFALRDGLIAWIRDYNDALTIAVALDRVRAVTG